MHRLLVPLLLVVLSSTAVARTWEVNADGSGDAPNLYAAMDSADVGDTVLIGPGHYSLPDRLLVRGIRLIGKNGAAETHLEAVADDIPTSGISMRGILMEGIHLYGLSYFMLSIDGGATVRGCIVEGGVPATVDIYGPATLTNNLIVDGKLNIFATCQFNGNIIGAHVTSTGTIDCCFIGNDVYGPIDPNITIRTQELNFFLDPQFCGIPGSGNYFLKSTSPCLAENNPYGVPLSAGPLGVGCGAVSVESKTWGAIKAMYMDKR